MADPVATPEDLALLLQREVDEDTATLLISLAQEAAEFEVAPETELPAGARAIVLQAAARAYANPLSVQQETVGPYTATRTAGGVYLTKAERTRLRRLAGRSGAFSVDMLAGWTAPGEGVDGA